MHKVVLRCAFFLVPLAGAAWAGCTDEAAQPPAAVEEAGAETAPPDVYVPPADAAVDSGRDCKADVQADGLLQHLDCTGLYSSFASKTVAAEAKPYTPGVEFWSDGAEKSRWFYLPPGAKIDIEDFDEWKFPNGTKLWKEFKIGGKRIETRLFVKANDAWRHTTYRWNDSETDAVRKDNGEKLPNGAGLPPYEIPTTFDCNTCHLGRIEPVLGIEAVSLGLPTAKGVTLATLAAEGRFSSAPPTTTFTIPDDGSGKAAPAFAWLHANCGACHNSNPSSGALFTQLFFLLRPSQLLPDAGTATGQDLDSWKSSVGVMSTREDPDAGVGINYIRVVKGQPSMSLVSILSGNRADAGEDPSSAVQMPPITTRRPDTQGHMLLDNWINAIP